MKILIKSKGQMASEGIKWDQRYDCPAWWNTSGEMDYLYGEYVEVECNAVGGYIVRRNGGIGYWKIKNSWVEKVVE